jgi:DNA-binding MarR family transcriptional regulator
MSSIFRHADESPGFLLWQVTNIWQKHIRKALEKYELTHPQFVLLFSCKWLNENNAGTGVTQVRMAQHAQVDVNVTSQVLRVLEKRGYVRRDPHPTDTRANVILMTEAGSELASRAVQSVEAADRAFFAGAGDDCGQLTQLLRQLAKQA